MGKKVKSDRIIVYLAITVIIFTLTHLSQELTPFP